MVFILSMSGIKVLLLITCPKNLICGLQKLHLFTSIVNPAVVSFSSTVSKTKLRGLSPHANYTDRAAAAGRRS